MIRTDLSCQEKTEVVPINVVYEPIYNENILVPCYFTLAYRIYLGYFDKEKGQIKNKTVHHCHYCQNLFVKSKEQMKKHLSFCGAKEETNYAFDNGQILNYQDNFKYLSELPFTVYFNFETTTRGNSVFFDPAMYVMSYCQIYSFHPSLGLDKVVVFRSFQQTPGQIYDLSYFKNEHAAFFDKAIFYQLKDAASAVLAQEKLISLAELFSIELKFKNDTFKAWFGKIIKPKFFEIDYTKKQDFRKEIQWAVTQYVICVTSPL